ncbi:MAG: hypothetical protein WEC34_04050 [Acidimicrobiia bacterium]
MSKSRVAERIAALATGLVALVALAPPAHADVPGFTPPTPTDWVAFTLGTTTLSAPRGGSYGAVDLIAHTSGPPLQDLVDWDDGTSPPGWPVSWSVGGVTLEREAYCGADVTSCRYFVNGSGDFFAVGGVEPSPAFFEQFRQDVTATPILPPAISINVSSNLNPQKGVGGPGQITLDASGTADGFTDPAALTYSWTVSQGSTSVEAAGMVTTVDLAADGQYNLTLVVTNPDDGHADTFNSTILVAGVAPDPAPAPGPSGGGPAPTPDPVPSVTPKPAVADVVTFAPLRKVPSALNGGTNGGAQVIWLWRPDWFTPEPPGPRSPRTATAPRVQAESVSVVTTTDPEPDSSATPWLAGLAVFGLAGIGLMAMRRRRMHYLDP